MTGGSRGTGNIRCEGSLDHHRHPVPGAIKTNGFVLRDIILNDRLSLSAIIRFKNFLQRFIGRASLPPTSLRLLSRTTCVENHSPHPRIDTGNAHAARVSRTLRSPERGALQRGIA
ncbi:MAG: hypothetical protein J0H78_11965 [Rhizobiales bacterium]|nr:hypothetical protein [Hyphomicrobiales bacterium]